MTQGYTAALSASGWSVGGVLHQTRIYPELVEPVWEGQISEKADGQICQDVYQYPNRDDRPNGRFAPALSVGDIVTIAGNSIEAVSYQVASGMGWIRLKEPVHADPEAIRAMKEQLAGRPYTVALNT